MKKLLAALLFCGSIQAEEFKHFSDWTPEEKAWFSTFAVSNYIDYKQTAWGLSQRDEYGNHVYKEANPVFGTRPSNRTVALVKLAGIAGYYYVVGIGHFGTALKTATILQVGIVVHNTSLGVGINVAF